jgi:hypothetical protein
MGALGFCFQPVAADFEVLVYFPRVPKGPQGVPKGPQGVPEGPYRIIHFTRGKLISAKKHKKSNANK